MNKDHRLGILISDSLLFAIGGIGTKFIMFIMVPVYTYFLSTATYGIVDLYLTTLTMLTPIITLSIFDAVFRFAFDDSMSETRVFSNGLFVTIFGGIITIIFGIMLSQFFHNLDILLFTVMLMLNTLLSLIQNYLRGIGNKKLFVSLGLISSGFSALATIGLLLVSNTVKSFIIGNSIGLIIAICSGFFVDRLSLHFSRNEVSFTQIIKMLRFSVPLIPNAFAWWFTNDMARFAILYFVGPAGNGVYAVATKVPALMTVLFSIFSQAWQISAITEYQAEDTEDRNRYYSTVFNNLVSVSFIGVSFILLILQPLLGMIVTDAYYDAWQNVPALLMAAVFSNLSAFVGTTYIAAARTRLIMYTTVIGMLINTVLTIIFVPLIGVQGAGIGGALGFLIVLIMRIKNTKSIVPITVQWRKIVVGIVLLGLQTTFLWVLTGTTKTFVTIVIFIIILLLNFDLLFGLKKDGNNVR